MNSFSSLDFVILRALHICLCYFLAKGYCRPLLHRAPGSQSPWLTVFRPEIPDWKLTPAILLVSAVSCVWIFPLRPRILFVTYVMCFHLFTQERPAMTLFTQVEHPALSKASKYQEDVFVVCCSKYFSDFVQCMHLLDRSTSVRMWHEGKFLSWLQQVLIQSLISWLVA